MEPHCLGKRSDPGHSENDNRRFVEAASWIARTGSPWRDLSAHFGKWSTAFRRFPDCCEADVFVRLFEACSDEPDMEYAMVDATRCLCPPTRDRPHKAPGTALLRDKGSYIY